MPLDGWIGCIEDRSQYSAIVSLDIVLLIGYLVHVHTVAVARGYDGSATMA
jgi:hypothetical protein